MIQTFDTILCPIDFDDNATAALAIACKIAVQNDALLYVVHVVGVPAHSTEMPPEALKPYPVWEQEAKLKLDQLTSERIPRAIRSQSFTRSGLPAREITAVAKDFDIDLIVMGTHGRRRSALGHLFLGSVAERIVRMAICPVLVVPPI